MLTTELHAAVEKDLRKESELNQRIKRKKEKELCHDLLMFEYFIFVRRN